MLIAASALTKVAIAVDATVRFGDLPDATSNDQLLSLATADDPELLAPFATFRVLARQQGADSEVLLCTADSNFALIEDAGCTASSDLHHWKQSPLPPCAFAIDLATICQTK